jgi:hypothetical protein
MATSAGGQLDTPVLLVVFNRPDTTARVFERVREARPRRLFVAADGPRPGRPEDRERCAATRAVVERVDWPCEVLRDYSDENLNCRRRPQTAIRWAFSHAERLIVLEDDCLPEATFFRFCDEMLERHALDARVMCVTGTNLLGSWNAERQSYHFSLVGNGWGWASWRRAWDLYDPEMRAWSSAEARAIVARELFALARSTSRAACYDLTHAGKLDAWDYQWELCRVLQSGLTVVPSVNLVCNIGCGADATHTVDGNARFSGLPVEPLRFPLRRPLGVVRDVEFDRRVLALQEPWSWRLLVPSPVRDRLRPLRRAVQRALRGAFAG